MNFVDFVQNEWLPKCGMKRLAETTLENYLEYLELRILPAFQYFRMDEVQPIHIVDFLHNLEEDGMRLDGKEGKLSSSTIYYYYRILNHVFEFAVELRLLKESPLKGVKKPKVEYEEVETYDLAESIALYEALGTEPLHWEIAIKLKITGGLRRSEIFGIDLFKHFDVENRVVKVAQALTYTKRYGYNIHEIKKGSRRARKRHFALSEGLVEPVKKLTLIRKQERLAAGELWEDGKHCLLLSHPDGHPYNPTAMRNWWKRFLKRHNLRYINIHALRHTMVTLLIELGIPLSEISKRAGHSNIGITNDTYGHRVKTLDQLATTKLDEALIRTTKTQ